MVQIIRTAAKDAEMCREVIGRTSWGWRCSRFDRIATFGTRATLIHAQIVTAFRAQTRWKPTPTPYLPHEPACRKQCGYCEQRPVRNRNAGPEAVSVARMGKAEARPPYDYPVINARERTLV